MSAIQPVPRHDIRDCLCEVQERQALRRKVETFVTRERHSEPDPEWIFAHGQRFLHRFGEEMAIAMAREDDEDAAATLRAASVEDSPTTKWVVRNIILSGRLRDRAREQRK
ncbi:MAG: hypothetical protein ACYDCK_02585 [Thermoplasmatota archaeon]